MLWLPNTHLASLGTSPQPQGGAQFGPNSACPALCVSLTGLAQAPARTGPSASGLAGRPPTTSVWPFSSSSSAVSVMQPADAGELDHLSESWAFNRPLLGAVLAKRQVSSSVGIVLGVPGQDSPKVPSAKHNDVVEQFAAESPHKALCVRILPRRPWRCEHFFYPEPRRRCTEHGAVHTVAISQQVSRRGVPRERLTKLLRCPGGGRMVGHVEVDDSAAAMSTTRKWPASRKTRSCFLCATGPQPLSAPSCRSWFRCRADRCRCLPSRRRCRRI